MAHFNQQAMVQLAMTMYMCQHGVLQWSGVDAAYRFGDNAPGGEGFCKYVRARQEGAILTLLRHRETGTLILAGRLF